MELMWKVGKRQPLLSKAEQSGDTDALVGSGLRVRLDAADTPRAILSGLVKRQDSIYGFSIAHAFDSADANVISLEDGKPIGRYQANDEINGSDSTDLRNYLRFFPLNKNVKCLSHVVTEFVDEQEIGSEIVSRVSSRTAGLRARVVRVNNCAYVGDLDDKDKFCRVTGGILVKPFASVDAFAPPGDSGALVVNGAGQAVGVVVARNHEFVLLAPISSAFKKHGVSFLDVTTAAKWNGSEVHQKRLENPRRRSAYLFTSEAVSEGHPDKVCDRISDEVVDLFFRQAARDGMDPRAVRVACETLATTNRILIAGEVRTNLSWTEMRSKVESVARRAIRDIGYEQDGFHWKKAKIDVLLHPQSADIAQGVDGAGNKDVGAGDQGIMFGYACRETPELMPAPIYYAHKILENLTKYRKAGERNCGALGPDAKSQVTVKYEGGTPIGVTQIVLSTQHLDEKLTSKDVRKIVEPIIREVLPKGWITADTVWHVNPTGKFVIGGPDGDAGLTGRKIIVDTYGGAAPHGGGAFSGKDPTKVDRSAAYAARYLAKNVVAAKLADRCTIQLSYGIGISHPLSVYVDLHGTGRIEEAALESVLRVVMDLSPRGIREHLGLNKPIYARTSAHGHFGHKPDSDGGYSWERTDLIPKLRSFFR
jgi:S-adenosylmethionine synthetase